MFTANAPAGRRLPARVTGIILSLLLIFTSFVCLTFTQPVVYADTYGDLSYSVSGGAVTITDCSDSATTLDIPAEIDGYPVTTIGTSAFEDRSSLVSVNIPVSVTQIRNFAFYGCSSLSDIYYGGSEDDRDLMTIASYNSPLTAAEWHYTAPVTLTGIAITAGPSKTSYTEGESFDPSGMTVTATYSDSSSAVVTGWTYAPAGALASSDDTVTVSYTEGGETKTAATSITVIAAPAPAPTEYEVTVQSGSNGTASADKSTATEGENVTLTATPDKGYHLKAWQSEAVTVSGNAFAMPAKNVTVKAVFEADPPAKTPTDCIIFSSGDAFGISAVKAWDGTLEWSADGSTWTAWDGSSVSAQAAGGIYYLYFRGKGNTVIADNHPWIFSARAGATVACDGSIMTLLDYENPDTAVMGKNCFYSMFFEWTGLVRAPELPATALSDFCYENMFYKCASLTQAPALPAEELTTCCYFNMFSECTNLIEAPALPAAKTAEASCGYMFKGCTRLTMVPVLPATELAFACYANMFENCTGIKLYKDGSGETWAIPSDAVAGTGSSWNLDMFKGAGGNIDAAPGIGTVYYYDSMPQQKYTVVGYRNDGPAGAIASVRIDGEEIPESGGTLKIPVDAKDVEVEITYNRGYATGTWFDGVILRWGGVQSGAGNINNSKNDFMIDMPGKDWFETEDQELFLIIPTIALPPEIIPSIDITNADIVPLPDERAGDHMAFTVPDDCHYTAILNGWWDIFGSRIMDYDDTFEAGGLYCACWNFIADDGYIFNDDTAVTINGTVDNVDTAHTYLEDGADPLYIVSANAFPVNVEYIVVSGGNGSWTKGSTDGYQIIVKRSAADENCFRHFTSVEMDGEVLTPGTDYEAEAGSTVITLKPALLGKLAAGGHSVTVNFDDGTVGTSLTIAAAGQGSGSGKSDPSGNSGKSDPSGNSGQQGEKTSPDTGDSFPMMPRMLMILSAGIVLAAATQRKSRRHM